MKADEVREHLASLIVGQPKTIKLGAHDTPKAVRNYFLVIAKLEGYKINTKQNDNDVLVTLLDTFDVVPKKEVVEGLNGYYRKNQKEDFNWPVPRLTDVAGLLALIGRLDLTPKPRIGGDYKTPRRES